MPQAGYREAQSYTDWTVRPGGVLPRVSAFLRLDRQVDSSGALLSRDVQPGVSLASTLNGSMQFALIDDRIRTSAGDLVDRHQFAYFAQVSPSQTWAVVSVNGTLGEDMISTTHARVAARRSTRA